MLTKNFFKDLSDRAKVFAKTLPTETDIKKMEQEFSEEKKTTLKLKCNLPKKDLVQNLNTITPITPGQESLIQFLLDWNNEKDYRLPYIYGPPGTGKSYISKKFVISNINTFLTETYFLSLPPFLANYKALMTYDSLNNATETPVLVLDDLGAHNITKRSIEILHIIIDRRTNDAKPTMITSNIPMTDIAKNLEKAGQNSSVSKLSCMALEDRLFELCVPFELKGDSIRIKMAIDRKAWKLTSKRF